jgi:hypothetical protein
LGGLHEHGHELHAYCPTCDRWAALDLEAMVNAGQGDRRLPISVRCRWCGAEGQLQVRLPMPSRSPAVWIAPPAGC